MILIAGTAALTLASDTFATSTMSDPYIAYRHYEETDMRVLAQLRENVQWTTERLFRDGYRQSWPSPVVLSRMAEGRRGGVHSPERITRRISRAMRRATASVGTRRRFARLKRAAFARDGKRCSRGNRPRTWSQNRTERTSWDPL